MSFTLSLRLMLWSILFALVHSAKLQHINQTSKVIDTTLPGPHNLTTPMPLKFDSKFTGSPLEKLTFSQFVAEVVNGHNYYRALYGAPPVSWSNSLYPGAQAWANHCRFKDQSGYFGENLAAGSASNYDFQNALMEWMAESKKYNWNHPGFSPSIGHFTQIVWKSTKEVACAVASCPPGAIFPTLPAHYVVCRYTPTGNVIGYFAQNVGRYRG
ncbi:hypothetical protein M422DRAFT_777265 [Sphaerobolus stellatus SS14]|nr:hypothetical protein M422DRAFT_777265 [Sphaerobolus stellatus SS14]